MIIDVLQMLRFKNIIFLGCVCFATQINLGASLGVGVFFAIKIFVVYYDVIRFV